MPREVIVTDRAPRPLGAYSQGVCFDRLIFTAGQVAVDPATRQPVEGGIREQTRRVLENVRGVLEAAGSDLDSVLKTTCFVTSLSDVPAVNEVYGEFCPAHPPARSTVQVGLPAPFLVEVEVIAVRR